MPGYRVGAWRSCADWRRGASLRYRAGQQAAPDWPAYGPHAAAGHDEPAPGQVPVPGRFPLTSD